MANVSDRFVPDNPSLHSAEAGAEMAEAFGWHVPPAAEELEADYAARRCEEEELLAKYPGLQDRPDQELIDLIADPLRLFADADDAADAAAVVLRRRIDGVTPRRPG